MATASIEVRGPAAEVLAGELRVALLGAVDADEWVSPVEVERSAELVIALIGLVFAAVGTAKTLWDWWDSRGSDSGVTVRILLEDGSQFDLSRVSRDQLEVEFKRRVTSAS